MDEVRERLERAEAGRAEPVPAGSQRRAGVLAPLFVRDGALWVMLTKRTESVEKHRGQIAFPGGGQEEEDASLYATALRETEEEIGVAPSDVRYLGSLSPLVTVTDYYVEPYVGGDPASLSVPAAGVRDRGARRGPDPALLDPAALETRAFPERPEPVLFYHYGETVIWGATARMLKELLDALRLALRVKGRAAPSRGVAYSFSTGLDPHLHPVLRRRKRTGRVIGEDAGRVVRLVEVDDRFSVHAAASRRGIGRRRTYPSRWSRRRR